MNNKFLIFALLGISLVFGTYVYLHPPRTTDPVTPHGSINQICSDYSNQTINELNVGLIHKMVNGYKDNQLRYIKGSMPDDAHSIWFDLETLKKFVYQVEFNAKKNSATATSDKLGLRIYYASYPNKEEMAKFSDVRWFLNDPIKKNYPLYHTLVMIPTLNVDGRNVDFNPTDLKTFTSEGLKSDQKRYGDNQNTTATTFGLTGLNRSATTTTPPNTGAQNHGYLIPPGDPSLEGF